LAQSSTAFGPLKPQQLPKAHRRKKSSLSEARASLSPYGHPLARPPIHGGIQPHFSMQQQRPPQQLPTKSEGQPQKPRMSLITKFERTNSNSATSSNFASDDEPVSQPSSAIFAQFTRSTPPTPPPVLRELPNMSPFKLNMSTGYSPEKKGPKEQDEKRPRVDSEVRRQALGWGKRRNSDGPTKVIAAMEPVPRIPLAFARPRAGLRDKENIRPYVQLLCAFVSESDRVGVYHLPRRLCLSLLGKDTGTPSDHLGESRDWPAYPKVFEHRGKVSSRTMFRVSFPSPYLYYRFYISFIHLLVC
jgi:hypothetical protein